MQSDEAFTVYCQTNRIKNSSFNYSVLCSLSTTNLPAGVTKYWDNFNKFEFLFIDDLPLDLKTSLITCTAPQTSPQPPITTLYYEPSLITCTAPQTRPSTTFFYEQYIYRPIVAFTPYGSANGRSYILYRLYTTPEYAAAALRFQLTSRTPYLEEISYNTTYKLNDEISFSTPFIPRDQWTLLPQPCDLKLTLFPHQLDSLAWMVGVESGKRPNVVLESTTKSIVIEDTGYVSKNPKLQTKGFYSIMGGTLCDPVGSGKTATVIALVSAVKQAGIQGTTLVVCPRRLLKQWITEVKTVAPGLCSAVVYSIVDLFKLLPWSANLDIVIVSYNLLKNPKRFKECAEGSYCPLDSKEWLRVVFDEAHEAYESGYYGNARARPAAVLPRRFTWCLTSTPTIEFEPRACLNNIKYIHRYSEFVPNYTAVSFALASYITHSAEDIASYMEVPKPEITTVLLEMTPIEQAAYANAKTSGNRKAMMQIACNMMSSELVKKLCPSAKNQNEVRQSLEEYFLRVLSSNIEIQKQAQVEYSKALAQSQFQHTEHSYLMEKHKLLEVSQRAVGLAQKQVDVFKDLDTFIEKSSIDSCPICSETITDCVVTKCAHLFCKTCVTMCLAQRQDGSMPCPLCRTILIQSTDLVYQSVKKPLVVVEQDDTRIAHVKQYGTKISHTVYFLRSLMGLEGEHRVIIFSQWTQMLRLMSVALEEAGVGNFLFEGTPHHMNTILNNFKHQPAGSVILMSAEQCLSGLHLIEATHVLIMDLLHSDIQTARDYEVQAVGRCVRFGQTHTVKVMRVLARGTLEEEISSGL